MVKQDTLEALKENHPTSSWALWSSSFPNEGAIEEDPSDWYDYIRQRRDELRPEVVLLSLNPSSWMPSNFSNFHSTDPNHRNDQFRDLVVDAGLEGAYMADLIERVVDPNSGNVTPSEDDVENLFNQLKLLGEDEYYLICFHQKVFDALKDFFQVETQNLPHNISAIDARGGGCILHCYRVWFHANWGANKDKIPELRKQLAYLKSNQIEGENQDLSDWVD